MSFLAGLAERAILGGREVRSRLPYAGEGNGEPYSEYDEATALRSANPLPDAMRATTLPSQSAGLEESGAAVSSNVLHLPSNKQERFEHSDLGREKPGSTPQQDPDLIRASETSERPDLVLTPTQTGRVVVPPFTLTSNSNAKGETGPSGETPPPVGASPSRQSHSPGRQSPECRRGLAQVALSPSRTVALALEQQSDAPTVRISIGRLEVRTAAAPARPLERREPPKSPRMTLDDYLEANRGVEP